MDLAQHEVDQVGGRLALHSGPIVGLVVHADEPEFLHQPMDPLVGDLLADLEEHGEDPTDPSAPLVLVEECGVEPAQRPATDLAGAKPRSTDGLGAVGAS